MHIMCIYIYRERESVQKSSEYLISYSVCKLLLSCLFVFLFARRIKQLGTTPIAYSITYVTLHKHNGGWALYTLIGTLSAMQKSHDSRFCIAHFSATPSVDVFFGFYLEQKDGGNKYV